MVVQALIWDLWSGKFPQTSCFAKNKQKGSGRLRMGAHGFAWVQWNVFARGDRKTRGNEAKIGDQDMFCRCGHGQQKQHVVGRMVEVAKKNHRRAINTQNMNQYPHKWCTQPSQKQKRVSSSVKLDQSIKIDTLSFLPETQQDQIGSGIFATTTKIK